MRYRVPLVGLAVAVLLTAAFHFLLYRPQVDEQAQLEQETATLEQEQSSLRARIVQLEEIKSRKVEINAQLARLEKYIPDGPAQPNAIRQLQVSADRAGVEIASLTFGEPTVTPPDATVAPPGATDASATTGAAAGTATTDTGEPGTALANIPVTMVIEGGYFQAVDFFRRLEVDVPRAVLVESVSVAEESEEGFPALSTSWAGRLFTVVPVAEVADPATTTANGEPAATPSPSASPSTTQQETQS